MERFRTADVLNVSGRCCFSHVQDIVDGDDPDEHAGGIGDGQCTPIVLAKHTHCRFLIVGGRQRDKAPVHEVRHALV